MHFYDELHTKITPYFVNDHPLANVHILACRFPIQETLVYTLFVLNVKGLTVILDIASKGGEGKEASSSFVELLRHSP